MKVPKVTLVVVSHNMERELSRTIHSLLPPYQYDVALEDIEIIVVDNGSRSEVKLPALEGNVRLIKSPEASPSPVRSINLGIREAKADFIGAFIDGARLASPGLCKFALKANKLGNRVVVSTLGYHLGPECQQDSVAKGYGTESEDQILNSINWLEHGYRLFQVSTLAQSSGNGLFHPIAESNALFMSRKLWLELDLYDERFISPGGGLANLDTYGRACALSNSELVILWNEGTFHQFHGGISTNQKREDVPTALFALEYKSIRGKNFVKPTKKATYLGSYIPEFKHHLQVSTHFAKNVENDKEIRKLNHFLIQNTYCKPFYINSSKISDSVIDCPVIVTGRGGSGTRLLSQALQEMNVFLGNEINETQDSLEWVNCIYDLILNEKTLKKETFKTMHYDRLRSTAHSVLSGQEMGDKKWGWKLPESILCLPELLAAFPKAKIIHLVRHPVSLSYRRTHMTSRWSSPIGKATLTKAYDYLDLPLEGVAEAPDYYNNAISWVYQVRNSIDFMSQLNAEQSLIVKFEDMVRDPTSVLKKIVNFLQIDVELVSSLMIDKDRINQSFACESTRDHIWDITSETARRLDYHKDIF